MAAAFSADAFAVAAFSVAAFAFGLDQPSGGGGAGKRQRKLVKPVWYDPGQLIEPRRAPREEAEALLLCDAL